MSSEPIPAWKNLGLNLKSNIQDEESPAAVFPKKRKFDDTEGVEAPKKKEGEPRKKKSKKGKKKGKKSKKEKENNSESSPKKEMDKEMDTEVEKGNAAKTLLKPALEPPAEAIPVKSLLKKSLTKGRKSVSFTPDTKTDDGDSIKKIYLVPHPFGKAAQKRKPTAAAAAAAVTSYGGSSTPGKILKRDSKSENPSKKKKKKQKKLPSPSNSGSTSSADSPRSKRLSYLLNYHLSKESWKFEKSKQNWLVRNMFDTNEIPAGTIQEKGYDEALMAYIAGLRSLPVRDLLLKEAREIMEKLEVDREEMGRRERARLVLKALGHGDGGDEDEQMKDGDGGTDSDKEGKAKGNGNVKGKAKASGRKAKKENEDSDGNSD